MPERDEKVGDDEVLLEQAPRVQGAIFTMDHDSGYVVALVGGNDYVRSQFNRAVQACRQPGSTYKPIYYSAALDAGYSLDAQLNDVPRTEIDPVTGETWVPVNLHGQVDFNVSLEYALVFSLNVPSVDLFTKVGAKNVEGWARRLGFTTPIIADKALALGASCVNIPEMSRAFSIFARNGRWIDPVYVRRVLDRDGKVLEDNTVYWDAMLSPSERLARLVQTGGNEPKEAIPARAAYLTTRLLREVVTDGYSGALRAIEVPAAGKTGTSSATMDLWFVAFTSKWLTTTWLGDDLRERPLGKDDAAYMMAVPVWARYMAEVSAGQILKEVPWEVPPGTSKNDRGGAKGKAADGERMELRPRRRRSEADLAAGAAARSRSRNRSRNRNRSRSRNSEPWPVPEPEPVPHGPVPATIAAAASISTVAATSTRRRLCRGLDHRCDAHPLPHAPFAALPARRLCLGDGTTRFEAVGAGPARRSSASGNRPWEKPSMLPSTSSEAPRSRSPRSPLIRT